MPGIVQLPSCVHSTFLPMILTALERVEETFCHGDLAEYVLRDPKKIIKKFSNSSKQKKYKQKNFQNKTKGNTVHFTGLVSYVQLSKKIVS